MAAVKKDEERAEEVQRMTEEQIRQKAAEIEEQERKIFEAVERERREYEARLAREKARREAERQRREEAAKKEYEAKMAEYEAKKKEYEVKKAEWEKLANEANEKGEEPPPAPQEPKEPTMSIPEEIVADDFNRNGWVWPVPGFHHISSPYGENRGSYTHKGTDISGAGIHNARIVAPRDGIIIAVYNGCPHDHGKSGSCGCGGGCGNYVLILHDNGEITQIYHAARVVVAKGQYVRAGETVAYVGSTGWSTGFHLHYGAKKDGAFYDAMSRHR